MENDDPARRKKDPRVIRGRHGSMSGTELAKATGTVPYHSYSQEEKRAFTIHINNLLKDDPDLQDVLPMDPESKDLFEVVSKGVLLCKLINRIKPGTIDPKKIVGDTEGLIFNAIENHNLSIEAARKLGCNVTNLGAQDFIEKQAHLILALVWQILRVGLLDGLDAHPAMEEFQKNEEKEEEDRNNSANASRHNRAEQNLLKWFNAMLTRAGYEGNVRNFGEDIKDATKYVILMNEIAPDLCSKDALSIEEPSNRARAVIDNATKLGCDQFVTAKEILMGNRKLNLAFTATLFHKHTQLQAKYKQNKQEAVARKSEEEVQELKRILQEQEASLKARQEEIEKYKQIEEEVETWRKSQEVEKMRLTEELRKMEEQMRKREEEIQRKERELRELLQKQEQQRKEEEEAEKRRQERAEERRRQEVQQEEEARRKELERQKEIFEMKERMREASAETEKKRFIALRNEEEYLRKRAIETAERRELMEIQQVQHDLKAKKEKVEKERVEVVKKMADRDKFPVVVFVTSNSSDPELKAAEKHLANEGRNAVVASALEEVLKLVQKKGARHVVLMELFGEDDTRHDIAVDIASAVNEATNGKAVLICWNKLVLKDAKVQGRCEAFGISPTKRGQTLWKLLGVKAAPLVTSRVRAPNFNK
ncbi:fimbrin [Balamuthia mandrillaris]